MKTKMRWMVGAVLLVMGVAACEQSLVHPDGPASLDQDGFSAPPGAAVPGDTIADTGYFGSGHYEPANPPPDTTTG